MFAALEQEIRPNNGSRPKEDCGSIQHECPITVGSNFVVDYGRIVHSSVGCGDEHGGDGFDLFDGLQAIVGGFAFGVEATGNSLSSGASGIGIEVAILEVEKAVYGGGA